MPEGDAQPGDAEGEMATSRRMHVPDRATSPAATIIASMVARITTVTGMPVGPTPDGSRAAPAAQPRRRAGQWAAPTGAGLCHHQSAHEATEGAMCAGPILSRKEGRARIRINGPVGNCYHVGDRHASKATI
jgi:hypothetical protein